MQYFIKVKFRRLLAVIGHRQAWIDYKIRKHCSTRFGRFCVLSTNHRESIYFAIKLKSAEQMLQYAQIFPFFEGLIKSQAFWYSSLHVWFLLLRSEVDVEVDVAIFKYFSFKPSRKIHVQLTCVYGNDRRCNAKCFSIKRSDWSKRSNVIIFLQSQNTFMKAKLHFMTSWPTYVFFIKSSDWFKKSKLLLLYSLHQWQISL